MELRRVPEAKDLIALVAELEVSALALDVFVGAADFIDIGNLLIARRREVSADSERHVFLLGNSAIRLVQAWKPGWVAIRREL